MTPNTGTSPRSYQSRQAYTVPPGTYDAALINHFSGVPLNGMPIGNPHGGVPMAHHGGWIVAHGPEGGMISPPMHAVHPPMASSHPGNENPYTYPMAAPGGLGSPIFGVPMHMVPNHQEASQRRPERVGHSDVPGLENRRGSYSTTESTPATPYWAGISRRENGPRVASSLTPSPQHLGMATLNIDAPKQGGQTTPDIMSDEEWKQLLSESPSIPPAVPAVFTPPGQMKSLEQSLDNRIAGNRNVYIRGLHPTTDDELLYKFASRFGRVETSKAIIDTATGACKGFGFAKFAEVKESEKCIRGFHRLGYEVGFARESFNSRLKAEGDEGSTNLYISNLPKSLNEVELGTIFLGYTILSSKILRDNMGNSRGVGFARFETRDVCDEVIARFNGMGIGEEGLMMNIRYADTPAQKELKRLTAERRQFRTNEYNISAYGTPLVGYNASMYNQGTNWRRSGPSRSDQSASREEALKNPGSQVGESRADTSSCTDAAINTPTSSECDEGVTIHADPTEGPVAALSTQSSPSMQKGGSKK